ncbi:hypothetical protein DL96DRAFT_1685244 [Flagelloscypha sp. PMI_526]|nr:hypothetical protein DL96DRAFT_1685244 [Flagelloscypha sp. PMI_526]
MAEWRKKIFCWSSSAMKAILLRLTLYPLLHELATRPDLSRDDFEYHSDSLSKRSKIVVNGYFAIIGTATLLPFMFLLWCMINRAYYEGLPFAEFQAVFIICQVVIYGRWIGLAVLASIILSKIILHYAAAALGENRLWGPLVRRYAPRELFPSFELITRAGDQKRKETKGTYRRARMERKWDETKSERKAAVPLLPDMGVGAQVGHAKNVPHQRRVA